MEWVVEKVWGNSISNEKSTPFSKFNHVPHTIKQRISQPKKSNEIWYENHTGLL